MIRIFEKIEDCVSEKYWNFVTEREFSAKDPHYFGIKTKIKNIINNHIDDKNIKKLYK